MVKLLDDRDMRDQYCGLKILEHDLVFGVGKVKQNSMNSSSEESSGELDDEVINGIQNHADPKLLKPEIIGESGSHRHSMSGSISQNSIHDTNLSDAAFDSDGNKLG